MVFSTFSSETDLDRPAGRPAETLLELQPESHGDQSTKRAGVDDGAHDHGKRNPGDSQRRTGLIVVEDGPANKPNSDQHRDAEQDAKQQGANLRLRLLLSFATAKSVDRRFCYERNADTMQSLDPPASSSVGDGESWRSLSGSSRSTGQQILRYPLSDRLRVCVKVYPCFLDQFAMPLPRNHGSMLS